MARTFPLRAVSSLTEGESAASEPLSLTPVMVTVTAWLSVAPELSVARTV